MGSNEKSAYLVDAQWLAAHRNDPSVVLIDTRPAPEFWSGHLAGARHFDPFPFHHFDTSERGMKEFREQMEWIFSTMGISGGETVVCYEQDSGVRAARTLWAFQYMGHPAARMLDGGLRNAGSVELVTAVRPIEPVRFQARPHEELAAPFGYILDHLGDSNVQVFDVRSAEEYYGESVRAKRGGAIPGAIHQDWVSSNGPDGALKSPDELQASFIKLGLDPRREVVTYCQGGYRAAHAYIALKIAGFSRVRNYLGSWGEWGNWEELPIEHPRRP
jgi:thiosulfate/3-mercaptopyruvate sulfurtransferase